MANDKLSKRINSENGKNICPECKGTGYDFFEGDLCKKCDGTGIMSASNKT